MKGMALAPSNHLKPLRTLKSLTLLLGATLVLSSCGTQQAGTAATVDGTIISEKDVQAVAAELAPTAPAAPRIPSIVLRNLILEPYVMAAAGNTAPDDAEVRKAIAQVANPSALALDVVRTNLAIQSLSDESKTSILAKLRKAKISVNPRYGVFDLDQVEVIPIASNWVKAGPTSGAK